MIVVKRAYDAPAETDGLRVLVDRLWPRGISKEKACIDLWLRDVAPSTALRKWFDHDPAKWQEFKHHYFAELDANTESVAELRAQIAGRRVSLIYGAKDQQHNHALALQEYLNRSSKAKSTQRHKETS
ncbi:MAG: DUF488 domain-containing protein [Proteobacteria bacterium]|nr:DUF488 domain-containing protein [Pseudomonadota bacterium]